MSEAAVKISPIAPKGGLDAKKKVAQQVSNEIVFAVVGHVGSGNTQVATSLAEVLGNHEIAGQPFTVKIIKARQVIEEGMRQLGLPLDVSDERTLANVIKYQDAGDKLRENDHAAIALGAVALIRKERAAEQGTVAEPDKPVIPDGKPRADNNA
ncbi:MAG TPA: hypothetical protein VKR31_16140 [Rhizomicrobium sp.]|nr:hypothetical protein [Rhizomicrobium sp.]